MIRRDDYNSYLKEAEYKIAYTIISLHSEFYVICTFDEKNNQKDTDQKLVVIFLSGKIIGNLYFLLFAYLDF